MTAAPGTAPWPGPPAGAEPWLPAGEILRRPLPHLDEPATRAIIRLSLLLGRRSIRGVEGAEHLQALAGAFLVTPTHGTRPEAILIPALLAWLRGGRLVPFLADWNFALIPGIGFVMRRGRSILLTRKPVKPAFLNVLRPMYEGKISGFERARRQLEGGTPVGVFPEGTTNRLASRLLRGHTGAAQLSLQTGAPVLPVGLRYHRTEAGRIHPRSPFTVVFGPPLAPPPPRPAPDLASVRDWHGQIMEELARLTGRTWAPDHQKRKTACP
jgi:1-acyl-sn-glycerol-3-phosphate acyltransferase